MTTPTGNRRPAPCHHDRRRRGTMNEAGRRVNVTRPLTHSLDYTEEGLAMKATRICSVHDCQANVHAKGFCLTHYARWKRTGSTETTRVTLTTCTVDGCEHPHAARGLCRTHIARLKRTGTIDPPTTPRDRVWDFITRGSDDACWEWEGRINNRGYGRIGHEYAHRVICELTYGPPGPDEVVLHSCDNPPCCNPGHVRWGSQSENVQESYDKGRR